MAQFINTLHSSMVAYCPNDWLYQPKRNDGDLSFFRCQSLTFAVIQNDISANLYINFFAPLGKSVHFCIWFRVYTLLLLGWISAGNYASTRRYSNSPNIYCYAACRWLIRPNKRFGLYICVNVCVYLS